MFRQNIRANGACGKGYTSLLREQEAEMLQYRKGPGRARHSPGDIPPVAPSATRHMHSRINPFIRSDLSLAMKEDDCFRFQASLGYRIRPYLKDKDIN